MAPIPVPGDRRVTVEDIPRILATIQHFESGNYSIDSHPSGASASGAYQYVDGTWKSNAKAIPGASQFPRAFQAPPQVQDQVAAQNVRNILSVNGQVSDVPIHWYLPAAANSLSLYVSVPPGNRVSVKDYTEKWVAYFNQNPSDSQNRAAAIAQRLNLPVGDTSTGSITTVSDTTANVINVPDIAQLVAAVRNVNSNGRIINPTTGKPVLVAVTPGVTVTSNAPENASNGSLRPAPAIAPANAAAFLTTVLSGAPNTPVFLHFVDSNGVSIDQNGKPIEGVNEELTAADVANAIKAIPGVSGLLTGIDAVGAFFAKLTSGALWIQVAQVVGGSGLVIAGLVLLAHPDVVGVAKKAGKLAAVA